MSHAVSIAGNNAKERQYVSRKNRRNRESDLIDLELPHHEILRTDTSLRNPQLQQENGLENLRFSHSELRQQMILKNHPLIDAFRQSATHRHSNGVGQMNLRYTRLKNMVNDLVRGEHEDLTCDLAIRVAVRNNLDERNALILAIAALVHDDGHPPTHHQGENIAKQYLQGTDGKGFCHEAMTKALVEGRANRYLLSLLPGFNEKKFDSACNKGVGEQYLLQLIPGYNSVEYQQARINGEENKYLIQRVGFNPIKLLHTPENTEFRDILANHELNLHEITAEEIVAALSGKTAFGKFVKELDRLTYLLHDVCGSPGFSPEFTRLTKSVVNQLVDNIIVEPNGFYLRDLGQPIEQSAAFLALVIRHHLYADVSLSPSATLFSAEFNRQIQKLVQSGDFSITDFVRMSEGDVMALMDQKVRQRFETGVDNYFEPVCAYPLSSFLINDEQSLSEIRQMIERELGPESALGLPEESFHVCYTDELHRPKMTAYMIRSFSEENQQQVVAERKQVYKFPADCAICEEALPQTLGKLPVPANDRVFFVVVDRQAPTGSEISQDQWNMRVKLAALKVERLLEYFIAPQATTTSFRSELFSLSRHPEVFNQANAANSIDLQFVPELKPSEIMTGPHVAQ